MVIWRYWEGPQPHYINLLAEQPLKYTTKYTKVIWVTPYNIQRYLPNLPKRVWDLKVIAHRADIIRAGLLKEYGGLWIDPDTIVVGNFDCLATPNSLISFNESGGLSDRWRLHIGVLSCKEGCPIIGKWYDSQLQLIQTTNSLHWTILGADLIHRAAKNFPDLIQVRDMKEVMPIHWNEYTQFFEDIEIEQVIKPETMMVALYHSKLKGQAFREDTLGRRLLARYL